MKLYIRKYEHVSLVVRILGFCAELYYYVFFQEEHIRALLAKPFRVPMANGASGGSGYGAGRRGLGMRRGSYMRASLHDPFEDGALVLFTPRELSAHEQLTVDRWEGVVMYIAMFCVCVY